MHDPYAPDAPRAVGALDTTLARFFRATAPRRPGDGLVVAFSGGPDSTALLLGLSRLTAAGGPLEGLRLTAVHLDHGLDPGSRLRARTAAEVAHGLGVETVVERRPVGRLLKRGESPETAGRRIRYAFLEEARLAQRARWIATAHHRDDQAETVLLRLLFGSGLEGLGAMRPVRGVLVRPLLTLARSTLTAAVEEAGIATVDDPTNRDLSLARNRVRRRLLPALARLLATPDADLLATRLARLAEAAAGARDHLDRRFAELLEPQSTGTSEPHDGAASGIAVRKGALTALPPALLPHALAYLHRHAGAPYPATAAAAAELVRQLAPRVSPRDHGSAAERDDRTHVGCDCGGGWRWEESGDRIELYSPAVQAAGSATRDFSYTLTVPGTLDIPELGLSVRVRREPLAPWMFRGSRRRAALALPVEPGARLVVRRRRPGDRMHPLGAPGTRKLKDLLIDRRVPRERRDRLPLLCLGDRIAWVPGVTVDEAFRVLPGTEQTWVAEVMP